MVAELLHGELLEVDEANLETGAEIDVERVGEVTGEDLVQGREGGRDPVVTPPARPATR